MEPITVVVSGACLAGAMISVAWKKYQNSAGTADVESESVTSNVLPLHPNIQYGFTHGRSKEPTDILLQAIHEAKQSLDLAVYSFTDLDIAVEVIKAHRRGVRVRIIADTEQSRDECQRRILSELISEGIVVKANVQDDAWMHLNVIVVDGRTVTAGSFNFAKASAHRHEEVLLRIDDVPMARDWQRHFQYMWNDKKRYALHKDDAILVDFA